MELEGRPEESVKMQLAVRPPTHSQGKMKRVRNSQYVFPGAGCTVEYVDVLDFERMMAKDKPVLPP